MARNQNREDRELETLRAQNRELKQQNRSLMKQVKKLSRGYLKYLAEEDKDEKEQIVEDIVEKTVDKICFDCGGIYRKHEILNRTYRLCDNCGKRGKTKILVKE